ncbi:MAG: hypothetical protein GX348_11880, partial [Veillonellaceae bacterium]|nr:hypothetical protein [Veillonellaceae bacterium]
PNIMIGSAVGLDFTAFIVNLAPIAIVIMFVTIALLLFWYRNDLNINEQNRNKLINLNPQEAIKDWALLKKCLAVLSLTIIGFMLHGMLNLESATIALTGAILLMLISRAEPEEVLQDVEWPTIFFFAGLFILVGGLKSTGVIRELAAWSLTITSGNVEQTGYLVLWLSAIASAFIDNIPFVATMIPMLQEMGQISGMNLDAIWWSLALGACLGGNGTLIGASANVIVAGIAEKNGYPISFRHFFKIAFPLMIVSIIISHVYLALRYF